MFSCIVNCIVYLTKKYGLDGSCGKSDRAEQAIGFSRSDSKYALNSVNSLCCHGSCSRANRILRRRQRFFRCLCLADQAHKLLHKKNPEKHFYLFQLVVCCRRGYIQYIHCGSVSNALFMAVSTRVGECLGEGDIKRAKPASVVGFIFSLVAGCIISGSLSCAQALADFYGELGEKCCIYGD